MTSTPHLTPQSIQQTARLTERLRQTTEIQQGLTHLHPEQNEREIMEDLNETIHDIIADTPLLLPEPIAAPDVLAHDTMARHADGDTLTGWLSRPPNDEPEPKSRIHVATLCAGTMMLSILAGYGSAQLLNHALPSSEDAPRDRTVNASSSGFVLNWSSADHDDTLSDTSVARARVRVEPVERVAELSTVTRTSQTDAPAPVLRAPEGDTAAQTEGEPTVRPSLAVLETDQEIDSGTPAPKVDQLDIAALASVDEPTSDTATPSASAQETSTIPAAEAAQMLDRVERLLGNGDIAGARLILRHLAEAGHGPAAMQLAQVYDADWLKTHSSVDVPANRDLALRWYAMARDRGQSGAAERVDALRAPASND